MEAKDSPYKEPLTEPTNEEEETEITLNYLRARDNFTPKLPTDVSCIGGTVIEEIRQDKDCLIWEIHKNMVEFILYFMMLVSPVLFGFKDNDWWYMLNPYVIAVQACIALFLYNAWKERHMEIRCERSGNLSYDKSVVVTITIRNKPRPEWLQRLIRTYCGVLKDTTIAIHFGREEHHNYNEENDKTCAFDKTRIFVKQTIDREAKWYTVVAVNVETGSELQILEFRNDPQEAFYFQQKLNHFLMKVAGGDGSIVQAAPVAPVAPAAPESAAISLGSLIENVEVKRQDFQSMKPGRHPNCVVEESLVFPKLTVLESPLVMDRPDCVQILTSSDKKGVPPPLLDIGLKKETGVIGSTCRGLVHWFVFFVIFTLLLLISDDASLWSEEDGWSQILHPFIIPILIFIAWLHMASIFNKPSRVTVNSNLSIVGQRFGRETVVIWTKDSSICVVRTIEKFRVGFTMLDTNHEIQVWEANENGTTKKTTLFSWRDESTAHYIRNAILTSLDLNYRTGVGGIRDNIKENTNCFDNDKTAPCLV